MTTWFNQKSFVAIFIINRNIFKEKIDDKLGRTKHILNGILKIVQLSIDYFCVKVQIVV